MTWLLSVEDCVDLVKTITLPTLFQVIMDAMHEDFSRWQDFNKQPRIATHYPHGVIELMPISDDQHYAFKYVNGHPNNPLQNKLTVGAMGMLADVASGYPILVSEMTLLTAIRTAAMSALVSKYCAPKNHNAFGIIGTGSQSEFQVLAHQAALGIDTVYYYDIDATAMEKFQANLANSDLDLVACDSVEAVVRQSNIITTVTASKVMAQILTDAMIKQGIHINAVGGDCPGKTELDHALVRRARVIVTYIEQTLIEGESQHLTTDEIDAEVWELVTNQKLGRQSDDEVTIFDSVGFALEDFSTLRVINLLAREKNIGQLIELVPSLNNPKDLFSLLQPI